jgi:hypothetical protein
VKVSELEECLAVLMEMVRERGIIEIASKVDGYLTVTSPEWRDVYVDPSPTPAVGSFSDDADELCKVLIDPARASAVDLERAAHLLRLLSDQLVAD